MLSIGWPEMMVVAAAALIIVGPRDLPALLRNIGQMMGKVRRMSNEFKGELNKVAALDDVKDIKKTITAPLAQSKAKIESEFNKISDTGVSPTGKLKPTDPNVESVYDAIKAQTGDIANPDHEAANASMADAIKRSTAKVDVPKPEAKPEAKTGKTAKTTKPRKPAAKKPAAKTAAKKPAARKAPARKASTAKPAAAKKPAAKPASKTAARKPATKAAPKTPAPKTAAPKAAAPERAPRAKTAKTAATRQTSAGAKS
jgi:sec-independent protein translocase protein TatB